MPAKKHGRTVKKPSPARPAPARPAKASPTPDPAPPARARSDASPRAAAPPRADTNATRRLETYRAKRSAESTPEPFGGRGARPRLFVVQKHDATRLHHDFRLEWGGTLWSWAVPNGPSLDPKEKRLAVQVEDHPVEYADFEGIIPKDNYGAGPVIVWDRGTWVPYDDPDEGLATGKLHFELRGYKMHGLWTLIRLKGDPKNWLLIKKADAYSAPEGKKPFDERSILSGRTLEELREGTTRAGDIRARLEKLGAPRQRVDASKVKPMLAETADAPFSSPQWLFELKYDGYRLLAARRPDGRARLAYRSGIDATEVFPEIAAAVHALPYEGILLDGEVVVLDEAGRPDFGRLQKRGRLQRRGDIERASVELPATLFVFDLLAFEDFDLRSLPLRDRKSILPEILPRSGPLRYSDHVDARGEEFFEQVRKMGLEGVLAKKADSPYLSKRSPHWLKVVADRSGDFVVVGYTAAQGSRPGFGALHLAAYDGGTLVYCGSVGTGFTDAQLVELRTVLDRHVRRTPPFTGTPAMPRVDTWVEPELVVEVRYKTFTHDGHLRHPVFVRVRDDKRPEDCVHPSPRGVVADEPRDDGANPTDPGGDDAAGDGAPERVLRLTRLEKIFWPAERYTKGDLIEYYRTVSPWLLPYLQDRPLVVTRYPDGIEGKSFYQKNAPDYVPAWVRTEHIWSESSEREIDYFVCDDVDMLIYIANMGAIPLHIWSSRVAAIQRPDWCILDLDPKGAPFAHVLELAIAIRDLCDEIGLPCFVKTSGSTGLHVLLPLGGLCTYEQSRTLAHLVVRVIHARHPEISTIARTLSARGGKVYLDWLQNRHGQLLAAPFCVRPLPGAPVSTPLAWSEVNSKLDNRAFTIRTVPERLKRRKEDPLLAVLTTRPDLLGALERLSERV
jgi:bifunctional non-homologous end joining protein LigD